MGASDRPLRVGLIGCGLVTEQRHLPALESLRGAEVMAVADSDSDRLTALADRFGIEFRYTDHQVLLAQSDIDAVGILTPTGSHVQIALDALEAGKHVLIEKPLSLDLDECDDLIAKAAGSDNKVMVGLNMRWHRLVQRAWEMVQQGSLGELKSIRSVFTHRSRADAPAWTRLRHLGGGAMINQSVHHFDLWHYLTGSEVERVWSVAESSAEQEDQTVIVAGRTTEGVLVSSLVSLKTGGQNEIELYGDGGRLRVSLYRFDGFEFSPSTAYPGDAGNRLRRAVSSMKALPEAVRASRRGGDFVAAFRAEWQHFVDCIRHDREPLCTLEDGRRALQVAIAASHSASSGQPIRVSDAPRQIAPV
jgi:predicted dehydrogenase